MKRSLLLIPLFIISCQKESAPVETQKNDSVIVSEQPDTAPKMDSAAVKMKDSVINNAPKTKEVLKTGVMRTVKDGKITRTVDAEQFPITLGEEFKIKAKISTNEKDFNIRFNQIKLPNGDFDGPFGREITYDVKDKGEVWLIIGKSNMASGNTKGSFTVSVE